MRLLDVAEHQFETAPLCTVYKKRFFYTQNTAWLKKSRRFFCPGAGGAEAGTEKFTCVPEKKLCILHSVKDAFLESAAVVENQSGTLIYKYIGEARDDPVSETK